MRARASVVLLLGALLVASSGCREREMVTSRPATTSVRVEGRQGSWEIPVDIAWTHDDRVRGLKGRRYLEPNRGMLFLYREPARQGFWMKDCLVTIDAAYVSDGGRIVNVVEMVPEPGVANPRSYPSRDLVRVVLEMPGGWFREHAVGAGDRVVVPPEILAIEPED